MTLTLLPSSKSRLKLLMDIFHLKVSLFFYFIFFLKLTSIFFLPARDIVSLYGMSMGYLLLEMVLALFVPSSYEDLVCLFASISL